MKTLIRHFLENNSDDVLSKSLLNCHVKGLHSIMLLDSPGKTIRLYITDEDHELNHDALNVGYHPHHCDLTLKVVHGTLTNIQVQESDFKRLNFSIDKYLYKSKISKGEMKFDHIGSVYLQHLETNILKMGSSLFMHASDIHTVSVDKGKKCAWLVFEGKEDKNYVPYCYSNSDLNNINDSGLYIKPNNMDQIMDILNIILL